MLPMPLTASVSAVLARCNQDYARLTNSSAHKYIRAKKVFVRDQFEVVDHRQLVKDCFQDFMEITVKAILKLKEETTHESPIKPVITSSTV